MAAMMRHRGIWPETSFAGLPMEDAIGNCVRCSQAGRCRRWLAHPEADPQAWERFCANAELFARLRHKSAEEMLDDPMVQLVMASDGVQREDLVRLIEGLRPRSGSQALSLMSEAADRSTCSPTAVPSPIDAR